MKNILRPKTQPFKHFPAKTEKPELDANEELGVLNLSIRRKIIIRVLRKMSMWSKKSTSGGETSIILDLKMLKEL